MKKTVSDGVRDQLDIRGKKEARSQNDTQVYAQRQANEGSDLSLEAELKLYRGTSQGVSLWGSEKSSRPAPHLALPRAPRCLKVTRTGGTGAGAALSPRKRLPRGASTALNSLHLELNRAVYRDAGARPPPPPPVPRTPLLQPGDGALLPAGCSEARARRRAPATAWGGGARPCRPRASRGGAAPAGGQRQRLKGPDRGSGERAGAGARSPDTPHPHTLGSAALRGAGAGGDCPGRPETSWPPRPARSGLPPGGSRTPIPPGSSARSSAGPAPGYPLPSRVRRAPAQEDPPTGAIWKSREQHRSDPGQRGKLPGTAPQPLSPLPTPTPHSLPRSAQPPGPFPPQPPSPPAPQPRDRSHAPSAHLREQTTPISSPPPAPVLPREPRGPSTHLGSRLLRVSLNVSPPRNRIRGQKGPVFVRWIGCRRLRWLGGVMDAVELVR
ncbi:proline-rich protein 2-like [Canis lupus familiaris]|uniref:proline-rich protein 2-like n=1 Tax=Canis lupus familiaris TaxID=9615 RepID=UPI0018F28805|nr:proline-rich protein 2-like [Canis lupus familiaris]